MFRSGNPFVTVIEISEPTPPAMARALSRLLPFPLPDAKAKDVVAHICADVRSMSDHPLLLLMWHAVVTLFCSGRSPCPCSSPSTPLKYHVVLFMCLQPHLKAFCFFAGPCAARPIVISSDAR